MGVLLPCSLLCEDHAALSNKTTLTDTSASSILHISVLTAVNQTRHNGELGQSSLAWCLGRRSLRGGQVRRKGLKDLGCGDFVCRRSGPDPQLQIVFLQEGDHLGGKLWTLSEISADPQEEVPHRLNVLL